MTPNKPQPINPVDLPGLPSDPILLSKMLDEYLAARRANPDADLLEIWEMIRSKHNPPEEAMSKSTKHSDTSRIAAKALKHLRHGGTHRSKKAAPVPKPGEAVDSVGPEESRDIVVLRLLNKDYEVYHCKIETSRPAELLRGLWESIDNSNAIHSDGYFLGEMTDRIREFRTITRKIARKNGGRSEVSIYTHASSPDGDKHQLHSKVLDYLREKGLDV